MTIREQAIRLCEFAANGNGDVSIDTLVLATEFAPEAGDLADEACNACCLDSACVDLNWRELWAEAGARLRDGWLP